MEKNNYLVSCVTDTNKRDNNEDNYICFSVKKPAKPSSPPSKPQKAKSAAFKAFIGRAISPKTEVEKLVNNEAPSESDENADAEKFMVAMVCDGMGGLMRGEIASKIIVDTAKEFFTADVMTSETFKEVPQGNKTPFAIESKIREFIKIADEKIRKYGEENDTNLGSTLALLILFENGTYITTCIGDSRIYVINNTLTQITKDQTVAQMEKDTGKPVRPNVPQRAKKHTLLQCMGAGPLPCPVFGTDSYTENDAFFLCSDGMSNKMTKKDAMAFYKKSENGAAFLNALVDRAKEKGESDNITGILVSQK